MLLIVTRELHWHKYSLTWLWVASRFLTRLASNSGLMRISSFSSCRRAGAPGSAVHNLVGYCGLA